MSQALTNESAQPLVIVGSGLAGYTVAREVRKLDKHREIVLVTKDDGASYSKPMLSNACSLGKSPEALANFDAAAMESQLGIKLITHSPVEKIDLGGQFIEIGKRTQGFSQLVLALGADPRRPKLPGTGAEDILCINDLTDYYDFRRKLDSAKSILILGAGLIGVEFANDLATAGYFVSLVDPAPTPLSRMLPSEAGEVLAGALVECGVKLYLGDVVMRMERAQSGYKLLLESGVSIAADLVISAIGLTPRIELARSAGIQVGKGIRTDKFCRTSAANVFALGDCAEIDGKVQPFVLPIMHAARALGSTLCGDNASVNFPVMPVVVKTPAMPTVLVHTGNDRGHWTVVEPMTGGVKALCTDEESGQVIGFSLLGTATSEKADLVRMMSNS
ncbi:Nitric oxide reductase FlRd-NAD(+) reductase [Pandoraea captiosa]|uniref:Nitric oxide reductase FlRd-NAD(+) reductase n=1 Tax=Pandoraea captiosa TaxID=2508302 RepID=A0A5E4ZTB5_9BURK|nr:FAD-dependent oxidoreductase [Pandoraea captiosa]VVE64649.1 Nitric oxide reductase FlRd-NAD(+) reductase [Pandoraea captiosa]